jgi:hypothetical protein
MLTLLHPVEAYKRLLLPDLADWQVEAASIGGDTFLCCDKFLNHSVPFAGGGSDSRLYIFCS